MRRQPSGLVAQTDQVEQVPRPIAHGRFRPVPAAAHRDDHVLKRGELVQQKMKLEHEPEPLAADRRSFVIGQPGGVLPVDHDRAAVGRVE